ncbi:hypothetical protein [Microbacterium arborescens]
MIAKFPDDHPTPHGELTLARSWHSWRVEGESWTILNEETASRAYKLWNFAADVNIRSIDDVGRGTVVQKLWNAVEQRIRALHEIYRLSAVRARLRLPKTTSSLDTLHHLGVIRPLILKKLKDVRNRVEHQDRGAPDEDECNNLVDSVWYFLRSTDYLAVQRLTTFTAYSGLIVPGHTDREEFVSVDISDDWAMRIRGWFRADSLFGSSDAAAAEAEAGILLELDRQPKRLGSSAYLSGVVAPRSTDFPQLIRDYFAVGLPAGAHGNHNI